MSTVDINEVPLSANLIRCIDQSENVPSDKILKRFLDQCAAREC